MTTIGNLTRARRTSGADTAKESRSDLTSIDHRLISMRKSIEQLESYGPLNRTLLEDKPAAGLVAERIMFFLAELAVEINGFLAQGIQDPAPCTVSASFVAAVNSGAIDADLASRLDPDDGPHNVLVQLSLDSDPDAVAEIVADALSAYDAYTLQVSEWVTREANRQAP